MEAPVEYKRHLLLLAEAQLLGWQNRNEGRPLIELVSSMGLEKAEWEQIKTEFPGRLSQEERNEVDQWFNKNHTSGS